MPNSMKAYMDKILRMVLSTLLVLLVLDVLWQVFSRFILNDPSSFTDEVARYLMIWVTLLGASYVSGKKAHVAIDLLSEKGGKPMQYLVTILVMLFVVVVLIIGGGRLVMLSFQLEQQSSALNLPIGYVYLALPLSGSVTLVYLFLRLLQLKSNQSKIESI